MNVYWSIFNKNIISDINFYEPENVFESLIKNKNHIAKDKKPHTYMNCPAFKDSLKNTYSIKFPINYNLKFGYEQDKKYVKSDRYDQQFFDNLINIRSIDDKLISIQFQYVFFCEESLDMMQTSCFFSNNDFAKSNIIIPGKYDIGKWLRPIEIAFINNEKSEEIIINEGEESCYISFLTKEKVKLQKFYMTDKIKYFMSSNMASKKFNNVLNLEKWYEKFKLSKQKNLILKEIKDNIME